MTDTYTADSSPASLADYLAPPVESSPDAAPEADLLPAPDGLHDEQSSESSEQVAPDSADEQPTGESEPQADGESVSADTTDSAPAPFNWDSPENPYLADARMAQEIRQLAAQQAAEKEAAAKAQSWVDAGKKLASGELDDDDIPVVMDHLINEISSEAIAPVVRELDNYKTSMTGLVASLQAVLTPEQYEAVKADQQKRLSQAQSATEIERMFKLEQQHKNEWAAEKSDLMKKLTNVTAQLAAASIQNSGETRTESVAVGAPPDDPQDLREYLRGL